MVIEMSEEDGINFITKSVKEIREIVDGINKIIDSGKKEITEEEFEHYLYKFHH